MPSVKKPETRSPEQVITDLFLLPLKVSRSWAERLADWLTKSFGTIGFLVGNALFFGIWYLINSGRVPGIAVFDPSPYGLLTTMVSLEAIFLSIIVLISQNRASKLDEVRNEVDFQVNIHTEKEVTKMLRMLDDISHKLGVEHLDDHELETMKRDLNLKRLEERAARDISVR
jgi:uncharacterized membrane protein